MAVADFETRIAELEVAQRRAELIAQINAALSSATDEQGILSAVGTFAQQHGVASSALAYVQTEPSGGVTGAKVVALQVGGNPVSVFDILPTDDYPLDANPILEFALKNPDEPLFVENVFTDPRTEDGLTRDAFRYSNAMATVILWFKAAGRVQGVMTFNWIDAQPFNEEIRTVFKAIQPVAAAVIANRRLMLELEQTVAERTAALRDSEKRLLEAQRVGGIGIWELNVQTFDLYWSDTMFEVAGRDPARGAPAGGTYMDIVHPDDRAFVNQTMVEAAEKGHPFRIEYRIFTDDGALRYVATTGYAATDESTGQMRFIGTMQDITAPKQAEIERERLAAIVNSSRDCIGIADLEGRSLYLNPAGLQMIGYDCLEDIIGIPYLEFSDPETAKYLVEVGIPTAIQQGYWRGETRTRRKDGTLIPVEQALFPITNADGQIYALATIITDISERKQAGEALRQSQQMLQTVLDTIPVRVFWKDSDLRYLGCNRLFAADAGLESPGQIVGKDDYELSWAAVADLYRADDRAVIESGKSRINFEEPQNRADGSQFWLRTSKTPLTDGEGHTFGMLGMYEDITERKQIEAERERLQQQIIEAQKQALAELSTPIIPIMDRIIVMPLVGAIDTGRSRDIMRSLLEGISLYRAQIAILDITGVPIVDSGVADHLNRTMQAARLKGAQTIITGVSDAVAETIVDLGIDWSAFETLRDLQTGLVTALERVGFQLSARTGSKNGKAG